ncbi:MAG: DUF1924 domain-containing protein [Deltaproteobacteria bacterium]|nr:DUF1924 domain-containing protein [Deltaproteobacteria bacterium]
MKKIMFYALGLTVLLLVSKELPLHAGQSLNPQMQSLVDSYMTEAKKKEPGLKSFSAEEGKKLFYSKRQHSEKKEEISCTKCHTDNPAQQGRTPVGKVIEPLSPTVNKNRFTDPKNVEKWFKRNCEGVLERECTAKEKGDFVTYMLSL